MEIDGRLQSEEGLATFVEYIGRLWGIEGEINSRKIAVDVLCSNAENDVAPGKMS